MPSPLRLVAAACAPVAMAFVRPGLLVHAPHATVAPSSASVPLQTRWTSSRPVVDRKQQLWSEASSGVSSLFDKTPPFEVSVAPSVNSSVILHLDLPGQTTKMCYDKAVRELSKEVGSKIPGFGSGKGGKHPTAKVIERFVGIQKVKSEALKVISDAVINEAVKSEDFKAIGSAELVQDADTLLQLFTPGEPIVMEVKVDVWPEVKMTGGYTGLDLQVAEPPKDQPRIDAAWNALLERNVILEDTEEGYGAQLGDSVIANMIPFRENVDGTRGEPLPNIASGDGVDIVLESGRYMPGLAEGMEGVKAGEMREIRIAFPDRLGPTGGDLEGTKAVFEVTALEVKKRRRPEKNEEFANSIRAGLTMEELTKEVEKAVMEESGTTLTDARNRALEDALLEVTDVKIPETLIIEQAREKFAIMMAEFREQGEPDEKLRSMITKENFMKYVEVVRKNTTRALSLGLLFTHIAGKEGLEFDPREVTDQLDLMRAEAKGQDFNEAVAKDKIEATLERNLVLDFIAEQSTITWLPPKPVEHVSVASPPSP